MSALVSRSTTSANVSSMASNTPVDLQRRIDRDQPVHRRETRRVMGVLAACEAKVRPVYRPIIERLRADEDGRQMVVTVAQRAGLRQRADAFAEHAAAQPQIAQIGRAHV